MKQEVVGIEAALGKSVFEAAGEDFEKHRNEVLVKTKLEHAYDHKQGLFMVYGLACWLDKTDENSLRIGSDGKAECSKPYPLIRDYYQFVYDPNTADYIDIMVDRLTPGFTFTWKSYKMEDYRAFLILEKLYHQLNTAFSYLELKFYPGSADIDLYIVPITMPKLIKLDLANSTFNMDQFK